MKSEELIALGLTKEQVKAVQKIHGEDLERFKRKCGINNKENAENGKKRNIITSMVNALHEVNSLNEVIKHISDLIVQENETKEVNNVENKDSVSETRGETSTGDSETDQKGM